MTSCWDTAGEKYRSLHRCVESMSCSSVSSSSTFSRLYLPFLLSWWLPVVSASLALWNASLTSLGVLIRKTSWSFFFASSWIATSNFSRNKSPSIFFSISSSSSKLGSVSSSKQHLRMHTSPRVNRVAATRMPKPRIWDWVCVLRMFCSVDSYGREGKQQLC